MTNLRPQHKFCPKCGAKPNEYCKHSSGSKPKKEILDDKPSKETASGSEETKNQKEPKVSA